MREGVLLLGGGGFLGSAVARQLVLSGRTVHVVGRRANLEWPHVSVHQGSLDDPDLLARLLPECGTVVHLASCSTPGSSARSPTNELENLVPTLRLLEVLSSGRQRCHLIYFSSGGTVYGNPLCLPVSEDAHPAPLSYHGAGKVAEEAFCSAFRAAGNAVTVLRPSNAYGPGQSLRRGFGLVRTLLEHARRGTTVEVWGDGDSVRDFVFVDDVAEACIRLVQIADDSEIYNVGSGVGYSISEVISAVELACGIVLRKTYRSARGSDVRSVVLDISRLKARTGWRPRVSLADGLRRTWSWLRQQP